MDKLIKNLLIISLILFLILYTVFRLTMSGAYADGVLAGYGVAVFSFLGIKKKLEAALIQNDVGKSLLLGPYFRLLIIGVILYYVITIEEIKPLGVLVGVSIIPLSALAAGLYNTIREKH